MTFRELRANFFLSCLVVGVTLGCCEIGLRLLGVAGVRVAADLRRRDPAAVQIMPLGEMGFRQKPGARIAYANGTAATANALGYRGPAVSILKPAGVFRVLLLGGSTTHGWFMSDSETIDSYMRRLLRSRRPDRAVEVVNLAFDGYDSFQILLRLRDDGLRFSPDMVIVNAGNVDVANARFAGLRDGDPRTLIWQSEVERLRAEQIRGRPTPWNTIKHWSYLARLPQFLRELRRDYPAARQARRGSRDSGAAERVYGDAADYFERNLTRLADTATAAGAAVLFIREPWSRERLDASIVIAARRYYLADAATTAAYRDTLAARMRVVAARLASAGKRVAYLQFDSLPPGDFLDDAHLTAAGNRRVAEELVGALLPYLSSLDTVPQRAGAPRKP